MIPSLNEEQCRVFASKYDFSGGQIENIARHYAIGNILHGEPENVIEAISSYQKELHNWQEHQDISGVIDGIVDLETTIDSLNFYMNEAIDNLTK